MGSKNCTGGAKVQLVIIMKKEEEKSRALKTAKCLSTCSSARSWHFPSLLACPNADCSKEMYAGSQHATQGAGHDPGAEMPQGASAVVGGDGVPLTGVRRCLRWYKEHALSCSMKLVFFARSMGQCAFTCQVVLLRTTSVPWSC